MADAATVSDITDRAIVVGGTTGPINFTLSNFDPKQTIRTVAANITSGNSQNMRILEREFCKGCSLMLS